jgi:MoxR-like ATPase
MNAGQTEFVNDPKSSLARVQIGALYQDLSKIVVGQEALLMRLLITLLADGHILVEGAPGLAKTTAVKALASGIEGDFHRVQFTPDLLPADLTGTEIYRPQDGAFYFQRGPIFHNIVLADEINRAPAKVQSALLEAMGERQITVGRTTHTLPPLFLVMATQNPIEQEGTYPLPEAQLDRFLMYVRVDYPDAKTEHQILRIAREQARQTRGFEIDPARRVKQATLFAARQEVLNLHITPAIEEYIVQLVMATRQPERYGQELRGWITYGASPRASIALERCARAHAWLYGRNYISPEDIHAIAADVLRHRLILSSEAEAEGVTADRFIKELLMRVPVP